MLRRKESKKLLLGAFIYTIIALGLFWGLVSAFQQDDDLKLFTHCILFFV